MPECKKCEWFHKYSTYYKNNKGFCKSPRYKIVQGKEILEEPDIVYGDAYYDCEDFLDKEE